MKSIPWISEPECPFGYPIEQLRRELSEAEFDALVYWMRGQTMMLCDGRRYDHDLKAYEPDECVDHPHGPVVYPWDAARWCAMQPVVD